MAAEVMVTGRMTASKKEEGNRILASLGVSASQAINQLYDYVIANRALPFQKEEAAPRTHSPEEIAEAIAWVNSLAVPCENSIFNDMTDKEIRLHRLASRGLLEA